MAFFGGGRGRPGGRAAGGGRPGGGRARAWAADSGARSSSFSDAEAGLRAAVADALRRHGRDRLEIEFRLGHAVGGRFLPGVAEAGWQRLKDVLDAAVACESSAIDRVVVTDTRERIRDDSSGVKYVSRDAVTGDEGHWMRKTRLRDVDFETGHPWCCRASVSLEEVDRRRPAPPDGSHKYERHKQRWSYRYRCWSMDLTRVASNLPHQLDSDGVSFEVEIELRDTSELFCRPLDNLLAWGGGLVRDACAILGGASLDADGGVSYGESDSNTGAAAAGNSNAATSAAQSAVGVGAPSAPAPAAAAGCGA